MEPNNQQGVELVGVTEVPLSPRIIRVAELTMQGLPRKAIAELLGISTQHVGNIKSDPIYKAYEKSLLEESDQQVKAIITQQQVQSVNTVIALRDGAQQERIKLDAARDILDRGGHKAIERVQAVIEHQASPELVSNLSSLLQELRKVRVVQIEEVSALPDRISTHVDAEDAEFTTNEENT